MPSNPTKRGESPTQRLYYPTVTKIELRYHMFDNTGVMPIWMPTAGDCIRGKIIQINQKTLINEYGVRNYQQIILNVDGSAVAVNCIGASLAELMQLIKPQVGDRIVIGLFGSKRTKAGRHVKAYGMYIDYSEPMAV